jgi:16S rRNA processing protein RimM
MEPTTEWAVLARILRPQGRKGEVLADLFTDFPERFEERPAVWLAPAGFAEAAAAGSKVAAPKQAEIVSHWLPVGRNAGRVVLRFAGVDSIEQAELLANHEVLVPLAERMPLDPDAAYISDLIGCTVYDRGELLGVVEGVDFPTTPDGSRRLEDAAPLLTVAATGGDEILIPFAKSWLLELNTAEKTIRMDLPEGLAGLNRNEK